MENLIAPRLFQKKSCILPGIGTLSVVTTPAETDFTNRQIHAPSSLVVFSPEQDEQIFNEFSAISSVIQDDLQQKGEVVLDGIGVFTINEEQVISFKPYQTDAAFTQPVPAERIIRQTAEHAILVGDKETNSSVMTEYFSETVVQKDYWWVWAIVLGVIGLSILAYYYFQHGCNQLGNVHTYIDA